MPLSAGDCIGPYEILSPLGAGGMGEVYRARDSKLQCEVAVKVLPEVFAGEPDRIARFTREAPVRRSMVFTSVRSMPARTSKATNGCWLRNPAPCSCRRPILRSATCSFSGRARSWLSRSIRAAWRWRVTPRRLRSR